MGTACIYEYLGCFCLYRKHDVCVLLSPNYIGVTDYSGFQITYIETPRKYNSGSLAVGSDVTPYMVIPPQQENFDVYGICDTSCTGQVCA